MNSRGRSYLITQFIRQVEAHITLYKKDRQPPMEDILNHLNVISTEIELSIRFYWNNGYEIDYKESEIEHDIESFEDLFSCFVDEYDDLLLPEKTDVDEELRCTLEDSP